ncbi:MAG TPA: extracellular solute-binding protein [Candidatus Binatia bacterium]|jgi:iron(III) transport system substrate-binding protein
MNPTGRWAKAAAVFLFALIFLPAAHAQSGREALAKINAFSASERVAKLGEGAKREGALSFYSSETIDLLDQYRTGFVKKYPFVKVDYWRGGGGKVTERVLLEHRAKKLDADVVGIAFDDLVVAQRDGVLAPYESPERKSYADHYKDKQGFYTSTHLIPTVIAYNSKLVKAAEAPRDYPDLLQPRWKGESSIDTEPSRAVMGWLLTWGEEKTRAYMRGLVANGVWVRRGHSLQTQLLCAGETKSAVELYAYRVAQMKHEKNCPIDLVFARPTPAASAQLWGATASAPHPHAAALFLDFILGEEGGRLVAATGRIPVRRGVKSLYDEVSNLEEKGVPLVVISPEDGFRLRDKTNQLIEEILIRKGK